MKMCPLVSRFLLVVGILTFFFSNESFAGAWLREPGEVYSKVGVSYFDSDQVYAPKKNKKNPGPDYSEISSSLYSEYGFTPKITGILSITHKSVESSSASVKATRSGFSDAWFYVKRELVKGPLVVSGQAGVKIPLGYDGASQPPLGDGQVDYEARVLVGKSIFRYAGYANGEVGYRRRNGDLSDEIPFRFEIGVFPAKWALAKISLDGVSNTSNDRASELGVVLSPNVFDEEYMKLSYSVSAFNKKGFGVEVYFENLISGANTAAGNTIGIGFSYQRRLIHD